MEVTELERLKKKLASLGASDRLIRSFNNYDLRTEARIKYEITKLEKEVSCKSVGPSERNVYKPKADFKDYISDYPQELHAIYIKRRSSFLSACSLKKELNRLPIGGEKKAADLQWRIWNLFREMDKCQKILDHFRETKRIMPTQTTESFSDIPDKKLNLKLRNLRSNRSKRKKTIQRIQEDLPEVDHPDFKLKYNQLNRKLEALAELDLQIEKLTNIISDE